MLEQIVSAYSCGFRSQVRICSSSNIRAWMFAATIGCSARSTAVRSLALMSCSRREKPDSARVCCSMPCRLKSSSRSSCVWTPSSVALVG